MKTYAIAATLVSLLATGQAIAACSYTLDATSTQIASSPLQAIKFPSVNLDTQRVKLTINGSNGNSTAYMASSTAGISSISNAYTAYPFLAAGDKVIPVNGIIALENRFNNFPQQLTDSNFAHLYSGLRIDGGIDNTNGSKASFIIAVFLQNTSSPLTSEQRTLLEVRVIDLITGQAVTSAYPVSQPVLNTYRIGIYFDQNAKKVGLNLNGINKGYIATLSEVANKIAISPTAATTIPANSPVIGQPISSTLITDASQMTLTYPSGTTDICGNSL